MNNKRPALTKRQSEIFEFLRTCIVDRGYGPTVREIGDNFGIKSPNGVMCHLKALEKKGLINRQSNMSRAICLSDPASPSPKLPLIGCATEGQPFQPAVSSEDTIDFHSLFAGENRGCLLIQGRAFETLGIFNGDSLIVDRNSELKPGGLVVTLDDRHNVNICRISDMGQPIPAIEGAFPLATRQILGRIAGLVRNFE